MARLLIATLLTTLTGAMAKDETAPASVVSIPDPKLNGLVRDVLRRRGIDKKELAAEDLAKVYFLNGSERKIQDLSGIEHCVNLQEAHFGNNQISSIAPLAKCINLRVLTLANNRIQNIEQLRPLVRLRVLRLQHNRIESIAAVNAFTELTTLSLTANPITSLAGLEGHPSLHSLALRATNLSDLTAVKTLPQLGMLDVRDNLIDELSPLSNHQKLRFLLLAGNKVSNVRPLLELAQNHPRTAPLLVVTLTGNPVDSSALKDLQQAGYRTQFYPSESDGTKVQMDE